MKLLADISISLEITFSLFDFEQIKLCLIIYLIFIDLKMLLSFYFI